VQERPSVASMSIRATLSFYGKDHSRPFFDNRVLGLS